MTQSKKERVSDRHQLKSVNTNSDASMHNDDNMRNMEDIFQKAEEFRQAADTLLRIQLARGF